MERHSRSMKMLSMKRPRPSIEIAMPAAASLPAKASAVKVEPLSVLKIRGFPNRSSASSSAAAREARIVGVRQPPRQNRPAGPVDDRHQIEEAARHRDVGVSRPKEFHLRPLSEPDVNLAAHPAPIIHPTTDSPSTNGPMPRADVPPAV